VIRIFAFITLRSLKNRLMSRLRRLKEPRYLVSAIAGLAYLWFMSFRYIVRGAAVGNRSIVMAGIGIDMASVVILVLMIGAWALPGDKGGLEFSEAEIQFLFPAPISRRQLLLYKIIRMQVPVLISSAIIALINFRRSNFLGFWLAFAVLSIYFLMTALGRARLRVAGIGFIPRLVAVVIVLAALSWFFTVQFESSGLSAALRDMRPSDAAGAISKVDAPFHRYAPAMLLFIPRLFAVAAFPAGFAQLLAHGAGVIALGTLFFFVATRLNVSFEEASIAASQTRMERSQRLRDRRAGRWVAFKRMPAPFTLQPRFGPAVAIFWKNLTAALRISAAWILLIATPFVVLAAKSIASTQPFFSAGTATLALFMCAVIPLIAPDIFRQDLRFDLTHIELLKSYPISGERLVAAEMAAPLLIVAALELVLLTLTAVVLNLAGPMRSLSFFASPNFIVVALLFAIPICGAQLLIRNAVAVFFPAWAVRSKEDVRGFVATGQRLLVLAGNLIVLAVLLLPAAILFLPAQWMAHRYFGGSSLVLALATTPSAALLIFEIYFGIQLVGAQFDRLDAANDFDKL